jgi:hypothetical protein
LLRLRHQGAVLPEAVVVTDAIGRSFAAMRCADAISEWRRT